MVGLSGAMIVASIAWGMLVIGSWWIRGSVSTDKTEEVVGVNQFFNFVLKCFAFVYSVVVIPVVLAVFAHVEIGGLDVLRGRGIRSA